MEEEPLPLSFHESNSRWAGKEASYRLGSSPKEELNLKLKSAQFRE